MRVPEKLKMARRMEMTDKSLWWIDKRGNRHRKKGFGIFNGEAWEKRRADRAIGVKNREVQAQWLAKQKREEKLKIRLDIV